MSRADVRFSDLESSDEFVRRHIGSGTSEQRDMLGVLNFTSLDEVVDSVIPASIRRETQLDIGAAMTPARSRNSGESPDKARRRQILVSGGPHR